MPMHSAAEALRKRTAKRENPPDTEGATGRLVQRIALLVIFYILLYLFFAAVFAGAWFLFMTGIAKDGLPSNQNSRFMQASLSIQPLVTNDQATAGTWKSTINLESWLTHKNVDNGKDCGLVGDSDTDKILKGADFCKVKLVGAFSDTIDSCPIDYTGVKYESDEDVIKIEGKDAGQYCHVISLDRMAQWIPVPFTCLKDNKVEPWKAYEDQPDWKKLQKYNFDGDVAAGKPATVYEKGHSGVSMFCESNDDKDMKFNWVYGNKISGIFFPYLGKHIQPGFQKPFLAVRITPSDEALKKAKAATDVDGRKMRITCKAYHGGYFLPTIITQVVATSDK